MKISDIHGLWKNLHHNASMLHLRMDMRNDYESSLFYAWMRGYTEDFLDSLHDECEDKFNLDLHFYQYGRSGATIAPEEWMAGNGYSGDFGFFEGDILGEVDIDVVADVLLWINDTIDAALNRLEDDWKAERVELELTDDKLARYDNAREVVYQAHRGRTR